MTSARAIDHQTLKRLYDYNISFPREAESAPQKRKRGEAAERNWGGYKVRIMLHAAYVTSMLCLLRYDEVLRIQWSDIVMEYASDGTTVMKLILPFRKTHQNGGMYIIILLSYPMPLTSIPQTVHRSICGPTRSNHTWTPPLRSQTGGPSARRWVSSSTGMFSARIGMAVMKWGLWLIRGW